MLNSELNFSCASLKINKEKTLCEKKNLWEKKVNSLLFFEGQTFGCNINMEQAITILVSNEFLMTKLFLKVSCKLILRKKKKTFFYRTRVLLFSYPTNFQYECNINMEKSAQLEDEPAI